MVYDLQENIQEFRNFNLDQAVRIESLNAGQVYSYAAVSLFKIRLGVALSVLNGCEERELGCSIFCLVQKTLKDVFADKLKQEYMNGQHTRQQEELLKYINKIAKRVDYAVNRGKYSRFSSLCEYLMELIEGLYEAIFGGIFKNKMREVSGEKTASFAHRFIKEYNDSTFTDRAEKQELLSEKAKAL